MSQAPAEAEVPNDAILLRQDAGAVATLTLNRPQARNALSLEMLGALKAELNAIAADRSIHVVVLAGKGPAFCAGHDLKQLRANRDTEFYERTFSLCSSMMQSIVDLPQPVIAKVHATATAAGCQLVASCDMAIAAEGAHFATPGVNLGSFCFTPMVALSRTVGCKQAMELLLTGEMADAGAAVAMGLINRAVPLDQLDQEVDALATGIAGRSAPSIAAGKRAFYHQLDMELAEAYAYTGKVMVDFMLSGDGREGMDAFLDKREPTWRDD